jgi:DNA-binding CsgD family transcriptional regulator
MLDASPDQKPDLTQRWLTPRERQVLRLLLQGLANKEIGRALGIGSRTIEIHVSALMRKFDVNSRSRLIVQQLIRRREWEIDMADSIEPIADGVVAIIGKAPSEELLEQIRHRIGPGEAAVVVSKQAAEAYLAKKKAVENG